MAGIHRAAGGAVEGSLAAHYIKLVVWLFVFWLIISGQYNAKFLTIGAAASFLVAWICFPLLLVSNASGTKKYFVLSMFFPSLLFYLLWLMKELIAANFDVARTVWLKGEPGLPQLLRFRVYFDNPVALLMLSNSITLTPGTIVLDVKADRVYEVHALTEKAADGIRSGAIVKKVAKLFGENPDFTLMEEDEK